MLSRMLGSPPVEGFLRFYRIGDYPFGRRCVWTSPTYNVSAYPVLRSATALGVSWPVFVEADTSGWEPGCYTADFHSVSRQEPYYNLVQVIVRPPTPSGTVLVKLSTNTWQAYNPWGGHSFYPDIATPNLRSAERLSLSIDQRRPASSSTKSTLFAGLKRSLRALGSLLTTRGISM
jgi:hypothetical protein